MLFKFVHHIAFQVKDYEKAIEFYKEVMGMEVKEKTDKETQLQCGSVTFYVENSPNGNTFYAFEVDDLNTAREKLVQAGCKVTEDVNPSANEGFMVRDPFGMKFYLSQV